MRIVVLLTRSFGCGSSVLNSMKTFSILNLKKKIEIGIVPHLFLFRCKSAAIVVGFYPSFVFNFFVRNNEVRIISFIRMRFQNFTEKKAVSPSVCLSVRPSFHLSIQSMTRKAIRVELICDQNNRNNEGKKLREKSD